MIAFEIHDKDLRVGAQALMRAREEDPRDEATRANAEQDVEEILLALGGESR